MKLEKIIKTINVKGRCDVAGQTVIDVQDLGTQTICPYLSKGDVKSVDCPNLVPIDVRDNEFLCNYRHGSGKVGPTKVVSKYVGVDYTLSKGL